MRYFLLLLIILNCTSCSKSLNPWETFAPISFVIAPIFLPIAIVDEIKENTSEESKKQAFTNQMKLYNSRLTIKNVTQFPDIVVWDSNNNILLIKKSHNNLVPKTKILKIQNWNLDKNKINIANNPFKSDKNFMNRYFYGDPVLCLNNNYSYSLDVPRITYNKLNLVKTNLVTNEISTEYITKYHRKFINFDKNCNVITKNSSAEISDATKELGKIYYTKTSFKITSYVKTMIGNIVVTDDKKVYLKPVDSAYQKIYNEKIQNLSISPDNCKLYYEILKPKRQLHVVDFCNS
ncbi:MAG: hypothetical protein CMF61_00505 [Magnetococcales bacterium]|nr:hypothetical protein [Magnetococcales bacterium]